MWASTWAVNVGFKFKVLFFSGGEFTSHYIGYQSLLLFNVGIGSQQSTSVLSSQISACEKCLMSKHLLLSLQINRLLTSLFLKRTYVSNVPTGWMPVLRNVSRVQQSKQLRLQGVHLLWHVDTACYFAQILGLCGRNKSCMPGQSSPKS